MASPGGGGGTGGDRVGDYSLWDPPRPSHLLQVSCESPLCGGQRLASGGQQPSEITAEVGADDSILELGWCGFPDLGEDLPGSGSVGHNLLVRDVGHDTPHWEGLGRIPPQGGPQADGEETSERTGRSMGLPPAGGSDDRGGTTVGGDVRLLPLEHSHTVYCDQAHYGPVSVGGAGAGFKGDQVVVGGGRTGCGGDADGGSGGGTDGGGGRRRTVQRRRRIKSVGG